ncbi:MATE family efflux transporter [Parabacteroides provencensis]|uniref:MATE family efflux transporter n=1 Tax=Parabacteroides provencensis TaxID=1944636 RepID=UPI001E2F2863|nr:MATE family efflux transporter [Parabacteroides provencensis]
MSLLVEQVIGITDTAFLGHVGETELAASAIAGVCYLILFVIGSGFGVGLQVLIARLNGEKKHQELTATFSTGLYFLSILAVFIIAVSKFLLPLMLKEAIASEAIYEATIHYLDWRIYGLLFAFVITAFRSYYVGITQTRFLTINSIAMVAVNVVCNYALVFGNWGLPTLGIAGAAIGSCIAEAVAAILFFVHYGKMLPKIGELKSQWHNLKRILNLSVWTMIQSFVSLSTWLLFFIVIERIGEEPLAISNIVRSICTIPFIFTQAFALTGSALVSNLIGEGKSSLVMGLCRKIIVISYAFCLPLLLVAVMMPEQLLQLYTSNTAMAAKAVAPFMVMLSSYFLTVPASVYYCAIAGTGNTRMTLLIGMSALMLYGAYILFVGTTQPSVALMWSSEHIYATAILTLSTIYMVRGKWKQKRI